MECNGNSNNCVEAYSNGPGIKADLALYIYGANVSCSASTIAYASACQLEDQYDRYVQLFVSFVIVHHMSMSFSKNIMV